MTFYLFAGSVKPGDHVVGTYPGEKTLSKMNLNSAATSHLKSHLYVTFLKLAVVFKINYFSFKKEESH